MAQRYKAHHPEHYPIAWLSAAQSAVEKLQEDSPWVSVAWARGEAGAVSRMKRLRSFRDGLRANRYSYPKIAALIDSGLELTFRKVFLHGVWDVQLAWKPYTSRKALLEDIGVVGGEDVSRNS